MTDVQLELVPPEPPQVIESQISIQGKLRASFISDLARGQGVSTRVSFII